MSFVCESCGWRDEVRWRNTYWDPHTSLMNWSDFKEIYPEMAEVLEVRRFILKGPYAYERAPLSKFPTRYVRRGTLEVWKSRRNSFAWHDRMESKGRKKTRQKVTMDFINPSTRGRPEKLHPRERIENWLH